MKNTVLVAIVGIALGFAVAWFVKPDSPGTATSPEASPPSRVHAPEPSTAPKEPRVTTRSTNVKKRDSIEEGNSPRVTTRVIDGNNSSFEKMMKKRQEKKFDARIARLVKELNLTPEQEKELLAQWSKKTEGLAEMMRSGKGMENPGDIAKLMSGSGIEETLEPLLSDEQKAELTALQEREFDNRVESRALKSLAKLSFLDLKSDQKDAVMDILYDQAEEREKSGSAGGAMMSVMTEGLGIELDIDSLGIGGIIEEQIEGGNENTDQNDIMKRMKESSQKRIDEKVKALEPVLDEDQLTRYRESLESKNGGMLGGILGGFQTEQQLDIEIPTTEAVEE
jgi:hypothetical protein